MSAVPDIPDRAELEAMAADAAQRAAHIVAERARLSATRRDEEFRDGCRHRDRPGVGTAHTRLLLRSNASMRASSARRAANTVRRNGCSGSWIRSMGPSTSSTGCRSVRSALPQRWTETSSRALSSTYCEAKHSRRIAGRVPASMASGSHRRTAPRSPVRWWRPGSPTPRRSGRFRRGSSATSSRGRATSDASVRPRLQLCWVGAGRVDAYFERDIKIWDWAAGALIAAEAGASVELPCPENDSLSAGDDARRVRPPAHDRHASGRSRRRLTRQH